MGTLTVVEKVASYRGPSDLWSQVLEVEFAALVEAQVRQHLLVLQHLPLYGIKQEELIQEV